MKLINIHPKNLNPKKLFRSKSRSVSRSDPSSFSSGSSGTTSSDSSESSSSNDNKPQAGAKTNGSATPTSVLPTHSHEISVDEFPEADVYFQELVQAFKLIDQDGDGKVTRQELEALLSRVWAEPPSEEELMMMLSEIDSDGDGSITLKEFGAISSAFAPPSCDAELRGTFEIFDANHDGRITAEELFNVFSAIGDGRCTLEECRRMISSVDKNGDGFVCFEDFSRMMEQQR